MADSSFPLRVTSAEDRETIAATLHQAGFTEASLCERLQIPAVIDTRLPSFKGAAGRAGGDGLGVLARLFVFGEELRASEVECTLGAAALGALRSVDLVRGTDACFSPVCLMPIAVASSDLRIACDREEYPDGSRIAPLRDKVFSAHNPLTRQFLGLLPRTAASSILELCAGTGAASLGAAPLAPRVVATDIAARSVHFGTFNAWLNGCDNVVWRQGDLYGAVEGEKFERIVAHPPYVPALHDRAIYRDGGKTGEEIMRRVVEGLPGCLSPGGDFVMLCIGLDTEGERFEERVRSWLGPASGEFDIIFALDEHRSAEEYARRLVERNADPRGENVEQWTEVFRELNVSSAVYGAVAIRRFDPARGAAETRRVKLTDDIQFDSFDWLFRWFHSARRPDHLDRLLAVAPRLSPAFRLQVTHAAGAGGLAPIEFRVTNGGRPFFTQIKIDPWTAAVLSAIDGVRTAAQIFDVCRERPDVPPGVTAIDVAGVMSALAERGMVEVESQAEAWNPR